MHPLPPNRARLGLIREDGVYRTVTPYLPVQHKRPDRSGFDFD